MEATIERRNRKGRKRISRWKLKHECNADEDISEKKENNLQFFTADARRLKALTV